ncbi:hypothetical protein SO694_00042118 [Aureococcus anophagefferens]|uniref:Malectin domain-containing protein n=1 Tax=Aureococcus anophagefferens TaxID=44056 RepID=A0ABR1G6R9_AURAN
MPLTDPKTRVGDYDGRLAQYLVDLHDNKATFDFCGGMLFQLAAEQPEAEQPEVYDAATNRMAKMPGYAKNADADNVRLFHGREASHDAASDVRHSVARFAPRRRARAAGGEVIYKGIPGTGAGDVNARVFKGVPGAGVDADADAWAGVAEDASSLLKMEDTPRRQLENKRDWVFSYDFADAEPTAKPTSSPTFTPCDVEGEYRYYLALSRPRRRRLGGRDAHALQTARMYLSFLVDGLNGEALISEAGFSAFAYAINDAAGDDTASIEAVILMDTCAMAGHNSNDDCLDAMVEDASPPSPSPAAMLERAPLLGGLFRSRPRRRLHGGLHRLGPGAVLGLRADGRAVGQADGRADDDDDDGRAHARHDDAARRPSRTTPSTRARRPRRSRRTTTSTPAPWPASSSPVVVVLLIIAALVYFKSRESEATARKDSWDMSQDFTDEQNLPASDQISEQPGGDQPQALQKITQAAEL